MGRIRGDRTVGIIALGGVLQKHWGAVGRDLATAGYTVDDIGGRLPVDQFVAFVMHAPPGTAVYHERNEGWAVTDYLGALAVDALHMLVWAKSADAQQRTPRNRPKPVPRPGVKPVEQKPKDQLMTVAEYAARTGMTINFTEEG